MDMFKGLTLSNVDMFKVLIHIDMMVVGCHWRWNGNGSSSSSCNFQHGVSNSSRCIFVIGYF